MLQRSRLRRGGEPGVKYFLDTEFDASTEPPPKRRREDVATGSMTVYASFNGAASEDGGELTGRCASARPARRFNGAAVRRGGEPSIVARVVRGLWVASTEPPSEDGGESARAAIRRPPPASCFNGAAVRRRRRARRRHVLCAWTPLLQRSRRPKTAESRRTRSGGDARRVLQRSRRPKTAERPERRAADRARVAHRFNGAAVRRRRRAACHHVDRARPVLLQRSRRPKTAESAPRLRDPARARTSLQRSRRPKTAESSRRFVVESPACRGFNGAAVRRRRRGCPSRRARRLLIAALQRSRRPKTAERPQSIGSTAPGSACASTEPPSEDGGELVAAHARRVDEPRASTEPPSEDGGEPPSRATSTPVCDRASTEPPSEDGGERSSRDERRLRGDAASTEPPSEDGGEPNHWR